MYLIDHLINAGTKNTVLSNIVMPSGVYNLVREKDNNIIIILTRI